MLAVGIDDRRSKRVSKKLAQNAEEQIKSQLEQLQEREEHMRQKYPDGTKVLRAFLEPKDDGDYWYEGTVTRCWWNNEENENNYKILYEDNDGEDVEEVKMKFLAEDYERKDILRADEKRKREARLAEWTSGQAKKPKLMPKVVATRAVHTPAKRLEKLISAVTPEATLVRTDISSLWNLVKPVNGIPVTPDLITHAAKLEPPTKLLPQELHSYIPNMVEFYILLLERQKIFLGAKTTDPIIQRNHFCNNYRELDRGTCFLRNEILKLKDDLQNTNNWPISQVDWTEQVLAMVYYYRLSNRLEVFVDKNNPVNGIPRLGEFGKFVKYFWGRKESGRTCFTNAHQTTCALYYNNWCKDLPAKIGGLSEAIVELGPDLKAICTLLKRNLNGVGDFNSWQVACDLVEAGCVNLEGEDKYTLLGPGAEAGLRDIFGPKFAKAAPQQLAVYLCDNIDYCLDLVGEKFPLWKDQPMNLKVIEHALCEFQKYVSSDGGKPSGKSRFYHSQAHTMDAKRCQECSKVKSIEASQDWNRCDTCRAEFCIVCCNAGHCEQFFSDSDSSNFWKQCKRCVALDNIRFS